MVFWILNHIFIATRNLLARVFGELVIYMCTWHQYLRMPLFMFKEMSNSCTWRGGGLQPPRSNADEGDCELMKINTCGTHFRGSRAGATSTVDFTCV